MKAASVAQLDMDEIPTAKTCADCKGSGQWVKETVSSYSGGICRFCKGSGRIPVSGEMPAIIDPRNVR